MGRFKKFEKKHGAPTQCVKSPAAIVKAYEGKLPDELLRNWEDRGWCAYGEGFLWTVNPDDYKAILAQWLNKSKGAYAFMRTAFGHIIYWDGENAQLLDVLGGDVSLLFHTMNLNFDGVLCDDDYLDAVLKQDLFKEALPKLGPPERDECYGFHPAIALGGPGTADTLRKVKLREHLALLAQIGRS
jgi:hypothetical protein